MSKRTGDGLCKVWRLGQWFRMPKSKWTVRAELVQPMRVTAAPVTQICLNLTIEPEFHEFIVEDVLRSRRPMFRFPEDYSVPIAQLFGVNARSA